MTDRQLNNKMKQLQELESQIKELEKQLESIKDAVKADLEEKNEDEHDTGAYVIQYKLISQKRLDSTSLKSELPDVYAKYSKESSYKKFTYKAS